MLFMLFLKKVSEHFKPEFQEKAIYFETVLQYNRTPNMLPIYLLFIADNIYLNSNI
jgi:hypothetical protein